MAAAFAGKSGGKFFRVMGHGQIDIYRLQTQQQIPG